MFLILATDRLVENNLVRSGRIDKVIHFQLPTYDDQKQMFLKMNFDDIKASSLAQQTSGLTFADLSVIPREIQFHQLIKKNGGDADLHDKSTMIHTILNNIKFGRNTSQLNLNLDAKKRVAYHEIGHLLVSCLLKNVDKPHKITILPEGQIVGNIQLNQKDEIYRTRSDLLRSITVFLASSIFEKHYLGEYSTLCQHDFQQIHDLLDRMQNNHMLECVHTFQDDYNSLKVPDKLLDDSNSPKVPYILFDDSNSRKVSYKNWSYPPMSEILKILEKTVINLINQHGEIIDTLLSKLIVCETLDEKEIQEIVGENLFNTIDLDWVALKQF